MSKKDKDNLKCYHIVFISNEAKTVPLWRQKSAKNAEQIVIWDYHVILIYKHPSNNRNCLVYDLDSDLAFPVDLETYVSNVIRSDDDLEVCYHRKFRIVPAQIFLDHFASDRSHMIDADGKWLQPPPAYPPIFSQSMLHNNRNFQNSKNHKQNSFV